MGATIESLVHENFITIDESASVEDAVALMAHHNLGAVLVTRDGEVVGLFTERDLVNRVVGQGLNTTETTVGTVSSRDLVSISTTCSQRDAAKKMELNGCRRLLVFRGERLIGMVRLQDIAHALSSHHGTRDLLTNLIVGVTVTTTFVVIALLLSQLPKVLQLGQQLGSG